MRFYPRADQSRKDALGGTGHIGNHGPSDLKTMTDRMKRYDPAVNVNSVLQVYGGNL